MSLPPTPSTSSKRKATPTSRGNKKEKKEIVYKFCVPDSEEDEEEESIFSSKKKWTPVESKLNGTPFSKPPPTNPRSRYVGKTIDIRGGKPIPEWWKTATVLRTDKKMARKSEDKQDGKLWKFYCKLAREPVTDGAESQNSNRSDGDSCTPLTPATPPIITSNDSPLTAEERTIVNDKIKDAGIEGLPVPGTDCKVLYKPPDTSRGGKFYRPWGLFAMIKGTGEKNHHYICTADHNCVRYNGVIMEEHPRCHLHKGGQIGFVLGQFTDGNNKKSEVVLHVIASFNYTEGDEEGKKESANVELRKQTWSDDYGWAAYKKEREALGRTAPDLFEIKSRRMYFEEETEMMKIYSARQTATLFQLLLWPDTTIKIICLNQKINLPNAAYQELLDEMDGLGIELKIHDKLKPKIAEELVVDSRLEIPFMMKAEPNENMYSIFRRGQELIDDQEKDKKTGKDDKKKESIAVLYFASSPFIIYAGQALKSGVHGDSQNSSDPVVDYKNKKGDQPDPEIVPIGVVAAADRYKWEFHLHVCALLASLFKLTNHINPEQFSAQSHPLCINKQLDSSFVDKKSWGIISSYMMKKFLVDISLHPK